MKKVFNDTLYRKNKNCKFFIALTIILFLLFNYSSFAQQGCLYKYNSGDERIFTQPRGVNKTYMDVPGPTSATSGGITSPAYNGSLIAGYTIYSYKSNDCVNPDPLTRLSQASNCVIWDGDSAMYPGYLVDYVVGCDLDVYVWGMLLVFACIAARFLIKPIQTV